MHSSFKPVPQPDYIIPVEIEGRIVDVYVLKRPFVDHFLRAVGSRFEVRRSGANCAALHCSALAGGGSTHLLHAGTGLHMAAARNADAYFLRPPGHSFTRKSHRGAHSQHAQRPAALASFLREYDACMHARLSVDISPSRPCLSAGGCVHRQPGQVCRPAAGPAGQGKRGAVAPVPRGMLSLRGHLRQGGQALGSVEGRQMSPSPCAAAYAQCRMRSAAPPCTALALPSRDQRPNPLLAAALSCLPACLPAPPPVHCARRTFSAWVATCPR